MTKFHVLTLFPEMIEQGLRSSIIGRAEEKNIIALNSVDIRDFTLEKHGKVDDAPYGGGAGMLMQAQPVYDAHRSVAGDRKVRTIYVTPKGRPFSQSLAKELAREEELILLCGHYEGIDERVLEEVVTDYVSIGDYVLTGGELAAMVIIDTVSRLIPGVLGNETSAQEESFHNDLLEYPQYTRPEGWHGKQVPPVLLSGNHAEIARWRLEKSREKTRLARPDLYERYEAKQRLIHQLSKDKRNHIHMMEALSRGIGEIICADGENVAIYLRESRICMVSTSTLEGGERLLACCPKEAEQYVIMQEFMNELLAERGYHFLMQCRQFVYTKRQPLPVRHKDIRRLGMDSLDEICFRYHMCSADYIRDRLQAGTMYGAFLEDRLAGFIGMHSEGSIGMLYVEERCRRQGIAGALESWYINRMLERGWIPYGQVEEGNEASICLQGKLGLYQAKSGFWWLEKNTCK